MLAKISVFFCNFSLTLVGSIRDIYGSPLSLFLYILIFGDSRDVTWGRDSGVVTNITSRPFQKRVLVGERSSQSTARARNMENGGN